MLEELDKMHEECQALREDSKVSACYLLVELLSSHEPGHIDLDVFKAQSQAELMHCIMLVIYSSSRLCCLRPGSRGSV